MTWVALALWFLGMALIFESANQHTDSTRLQRAIVVILWPVMAVGLVVLTILEKFGVEWAGRLLR